jgi:hypothetical protein
MMLKKLLPILILLTTLVLAQADWKSYGTVTNDDGKESTCYFDPDSVELRGTSVFVWISDSDEPYLFQVEINKSRIRIVKMADENAEVLEETPDAEWDPIEDDTLNYALYAETVEVLKKRAEK